MSIGTVDARLSRNKRGKSVVTVPFLTASLLGKLFSDMVRVVDCHAGVLGLNPGGPQKFSLWNCFITERSENTPGGVDSGRVDPRLT